LFAFYNLYNFSTPVKGASAVAVLEENNPIPSDKVEEQPEHDTTIFVKNLNFATTDESMRKHFEFCGPIFSATVARKKDPKNPGQFLSMGYGFVQFLSKKATVTALKELQNSTLDGHNIELKVGFFKNVFCSCLLMQYCFSSVRIVLKINKKQ
jgi:multiple RNA-binding domain-containing protein 1